MGEKGSNFLGDSIKCCWLAWQFWSSRIVFSGLGEPSNRSHRSSRRPIMPNPTKLFRLTRENFPYNFPLPHFGYREKNLHGIKRINSRRRSCVFTGLPIAARLSANIHCNSRVGAFLWYNSYRKQQFVYLLAWAAGSCYTCWGCW